MRLLHNADVLARRLHALEAANLESQRREPE
jgi:hypothetical protein